MSNEVRAPLFDRFGGRGLSWYGAKVSRTLGRAELIESVRRELQRLFNTRCPLPADRLENRPRTTLEYGIPDLSEFTTDHHADRERLERELEQAIQAYEPRLRQARVTVEPPKAEGAEGRRRLRAQIAGILVIDSVEEPVLFPTLLEDGEHDEVRIDAHG